MQAREQVRVCAPSRMLPNWTHLGFSSAAAASFFPATCGRRLQVHPSAHLGTHALPRACAHMHARTHGRARSELRRGLGGYEMNAQHVRHVRCMHAHPGRREGSVQAAQIERHVAHLTRNLQVRVRVTRAPCVAAPRGEVAVEKILAS